MQAQFSGFSGFDNEGQQIKEFKNTMNNLTFGSNDSYYVKGDLVQRYLKRVELMNKHQNTQMTAEFGPDAHVLQFFTSPEEELTTEQAIERAKEQGNVIDLNG